jgi:hypothetical protein
LITAIVKGLPSIMNGPLHALRLGGRSPHPALIHPE